MNAARLLVGIEGLALGDIAYQTALEFMLKTDVRAGLSTQRSVTSPSQPTTFCAPRRSSHDAQRQVDQRSDALGIYCAINLDLMHHASDDTVRDDAADMTALLTPIIKSYFTERGFENIFGHDAGLRWLWLHHRLVHRAVSP